ncbi:MAG: tlcA-B [Parachlamydiales bacterium]|nr:tlcA-B [Parachlamydiales bacterium]
MALEAKPTFSKWRERLWPIHAFELKKIIPLLFMKFFISFTYGILTAMKDGFVVTSRGGGAEVIPVLKGWIVLPIALGATLLYSKLTNSFRRTTLFYSIILIFISFVALYGFVLYPNLDALSPHQSADWLLGIVGKENSHWIAIYRNWMQTLFFVTAELWGGIVIFLLFWGFVNHISKFNDAKRYYNLFIAGGDLAQIFTGPLVCYYTRKFIGADFPFALKHLTCYVVVFGLIIMTLYWFLNRYILTDRRFFNPEEHNISLEGEKTKLSLRESLKLIVKSKYLRYIAMMVVAYGLTMNLVEVTWKANLKLAYPDTGAYQAFMASISSSVGICSLCITTMLSGVIIRSLGWHFCAQVPPIIVGTGAVVFLTVYLNQSWLAPIITPLGMTPLMLIVMLGAFHNISSKVSKYAFFDATKEMAYIPLDQESKIKGKAAIDVIGGRLGKSGAAWIQVALIQIAGTGSVLSITNFLLPLIACTALFWILSVRSLNKEFAAKRTTEVPVN